jgi:amino acid transporter
MAEQLTAPTTTQSAVPALSADEQRKRKLLMIGSLVVLVVIFILLVIASILAVQPQNRELTRSLRDVAIIFLTFLFIWIGVMLVILLYLVTMLTLLLRDEVKPLLESINETMNTVRGTTVFMSNNVVNPTIKVASALSGVWRTLETLAGIRSSVQPKQRKE